MSKTSVLSLVVLYVFRRNQTCATITGASNNKDRCGCTEGLRIGLLPGPAQIPISDTKNFRQIIAEARVASIGDCKDPYRLQSVSRSSRCGLSR